MRLADRRRFLIAMGTVAFSVTRPLFAQGKPHRIGFFYNASRESAIATGRYPAFLQGMRELGYVEGRDFVMEARFFPVNTAAEVAEELVRSNVEVIVSQGGPAALALKRATSTIPVVISLTNDAVREGFAASLQHPGGNFTGLGAFLTQIFPKHIEMLQLVVPKLKRIACLSLSRNTFHPEMLELVKEAGRKSQVEVLNAVCDAPSNLEQSIDGAAERRAQGIIILGSAVFVQYFGQIARFTASRRLASIYSGREYPAAGGLMSYGPDFRDNYRRAAGYVDKILKGAKPGDLPIEQPTKFELVVNRKAFAAIGAKLSDKLRLLVDDIIE